MTQNDVIKK